MQYIYSHIWRRIMVIAKIEGDYRAHIKTVKAQLLKNNGDAIWLPSLPEYILFLHSFSGFDTTSALFNQEKMNCFYVLRKNPDWSKLVQLINKQNVYPEIITEAGERILLALCRYSVVKGISYNNYRYTCLQNQHTNINLILHSC